MLVSVGEISCYFEGPTPAPPREERVGVSFEELESAHVS